MEEPASVLWACANDALYMRAVFQKELSIRETAIDHEPCNQFDVGRFFDLLGYEKFIAMLELPFEAFLEHWDDPVFESQEEQDNIRERAQEHFSQCKRCQLCNERHLWIESQIQELMKNEPQLDQLRREAEETSHLEHLNA